MLKVFLGHKRSEIENLIKPIFDDAPLKESDDDVDFIIYLHKAGSVVRSELKGMEILFICLPFEMMT